MIVWRARGKIIRRSLLCSIVCNNCARCSAHTFVIFSLWATILINLNLNLNINRPSSCLLVRFSFSVIILCVTVYPC